MDIEIGNESYPKRVFRGRAGVTTTPKALTATEMWRYGRKRQSDEVIVVVKLKTHEDPVMYLRIKF